MVAMTNTSLSAEWFDRARTLTPGGVNSPVRAFGSVGDKPALSPALRGPRSLMWTATSMLICSARGDPC